MADNNRDSTSTFIFAFCSGMGLPYTSYSDEALERIICYKKNNLKAAERTIKAITAYQSDVSIISQIEILEQLVKELNGFLLNGLFSIGFWGISVENGKPIRVDSMGANISKRYDSVYSNMTEEEYNSLDRTESMVIDQEEARKFNKYILWYKTKISETLVPQISIQSENKNPLHTSNAITLNASAFYRSLEKIGNEFTRYEAGTGVVAPPKYSTDELDPVLPTSSFPLISEYEKNND